MAEANVNKLHFQAKRYGVFSGPPFDGLLVYLLSEIVFFSVHLSDYRLVQPGCDDNKFRSYSLRFVERQ